MYTQSKPEKWYAIRRGRIPGIYRTWLEASQQVIGFPEARYKGFTSHFLRRDGDKNSFLLTQRGIGQFRNEIEFVLLYSVLCYDHNRWTHLSQHGDHPSSVSDIKTRHFIQQ